VAQEELAELEAIWNRPFDEFNNKNIILMNVLRDLEPSQEFEVSVQVVPRRTDSGEVVTLTPPIFEFRAYAPGEEDEIG